MSNEVMLPNGDRQLTLSFIAPSEYHMLSISCIATRLNNMGMLVDFNQSIAVLMIQGKNHCDNMHTYTHTLTHLIRNLVWCW